MKHMYMPMIHIDMPMIHIDMPMIHIDMLIMVYGYGEPTQVLLSTARTSADAMNQNSCTIGLDTSPSSLSSPPAEAWWETSVWDVCNTVSSTTKKLCHDERETGRKIDRGIEAVSENLKQYVLRFTFHLRTLEKLGVASG